MQQYNLQYNACTLATLALSHTLSMHTTLSVKAEGRRSRLTAFVLQTSEFGHGLVRSAANGQSPEELYRGECALSVKRQEHTHYMNK